MTANSIPNSIIRTCLWRLRFSCALGTLIGRLAAPGFAADSNALNAASPLRDETAFLTLTVPKSKIVIGEVFTVDLQLFVMNPQDVNMPEIQADGFTLQPLAQPTRTRKTLGEKVFEVFSFQTLATPAKTGVLSLGPAECTLVLRLRKQSEPGEGVRNVFGSGVELWQTNIVSAPVLVEVSELPTKNRPDAFTGAVGTFSLSVRARPSAVPVGDPVTVNIEIAGQGSLNTLVLPEPRQWLEFTTYPPSSVLKTSDKLGLRGIKTFEQIVVPQNSEIRELPSVAFAFFDPEQNDYVTLTQPPIPLDVQPRPQTEKRVTLRALPTASGDGPDFAHIKPFLGTLRDMPTPLLFQPWFVALLAFPPIVWISLSIWQKRSNRLETLDSPRNPPSSGDLSPQRLGELRELAESGDETVFFASLFRLLQELLGDRLAMPAAAITEEVIDERLHPQETPEAIRTELHALFQLCNQSRYAPHRSPQDLSSIVPRIEAVAGKLIGTSPKPRSSRDL